MGRAQSTAIDQSTTLAWFSNVRENIAYFVGRSKQSRKKKKLLTTTNI